jgi:lipoprotein-anchoring transpeptidase ErfK/SrfK
MAKIFLMLGMSQGAGWDVIDEKTLQSMKNIAYILIAIATFLASASWFSACGKPGDGLTPTVAAAEVAPVEEVVDTVPALEFDTAEEAVEYMKESGHWNEYKAGILPQMAGEELDYATRLLNNTYDGFVVVDKARMKVVKFNRFGEEEATYGMACGKNYGTKHHANDCRTPEGFFKVKRIQNSTDWHYTDENGVVSKKTGEFGPRFIRLDIPGISSIGIHGTCAPWSIGGRRSHGCIRLENENILALVEMVEPGMPVIVNPGKRDLAVDRKEGYDIPQIHTLIQKAPAKKLR